MIGNSLCEMPGELRAPALSLMIYCHAVGMAIAAARLAATCRILDFALRNNRLAIQKACGKTPAQISFECSSEIRSDNRSRRSGYLSCFTSEKANTRHSS
jgi:hypothetical protein